MPKDLRSKIIRLAHTHPELRDHLLPLLAEDVQHPKTARVRPLHEIAREIRGDWKKVNYAAKPYLEAMEELDSINDDYYQDSASSIVRYFLVNARSWRGPVAKAVKAELNKMLR